jgi:hypothetical protein
MQRKLLWACRGYVICFHRAKKADVGLGLSYKSKNVTHTAFVPYWALRRLAWNQSVATKDCRQKQKAFMGFELAIPKLAPRKWYAVCTSDNYKQQKQHLVTSVGIIDTLHWNGFQN